MLALHNNFQIESTDGSALLFYLQIQHSYVITVADNQVHEALRANARFAALPQTLKILPVGSCAAVTPVFRMIISRNNGLSFL